MPLFPLGRAYSGATFSIDLCFCAGLNATCLVHFFGVILYAPGFVVVPTILKRPPNSTQQIRRSSELHCRLSLLSVSNTHRILLRF
ncbi:uncharacterized protein PHACADRAFT_266610 [Phanerochaete carnosa HHB-10118-sp]|uniref:Uncharacterized protein n=1 Tax=Phanerochaete carnosa (strain HHB-10118-sp) TaxID=650164 RepID=K5WCS5_PHACS|nr:uncharacterized protein PHACADRAFT_266610 [Phanerochaete carnosa HHB-10118-sp]EKM47977.1 hypothetical protein PHACADRAFT_266610 [Phanerochaete carnosa HHB-10118-sp]